MDQKTLRKNPPKGPDMLAQGNALGIETDSTRKPRRGDTKRHPLFP